MADTRPLLSYFSGYEDKYPRRLAECFPHVIKRMEEQWNDTEAMMEYFTDLMIPARPNRKGFAPDIAAEIFTLSVAYDAIRENNAVKNTDLWAFERAVAELEQLGIPRTTMSFARAAEAGDHSLCMLFISAGFDVDTRDARHWTPLMIASFNGKEALALGLILHGAKVRAEDKGGYSPMHWAAYNGYARVIRLLLLEGGAVNASSRSGITPLLQAAARGRVAAVEELLKGGADPNIAANDGTTPLLKAVANGQLAVIDLLLASGAMADVTMKDGTTLAQIAKASKSRRIRERIAKALQAAQ
ncbi:MAG: ankyrin repeat domain-containing protein [Rhodocyclaceae bacterium]|nr:ankyrin repeat domain-containing protein [Rhodocyclaceae bacterium]